MFRFVVDHFIEKGLIPDVPMKLGTQYPDFKKAGLIIKSDELPEEMWLASDEQQFKWLDDRIPGGRSEGHWSYRSKGR
ncbi:hypothetical protein ACJTM1_17430 [Bacillus sp. GX]|nr:hypothetical protein [Bacillus albus]KMP34624.1 hypothetical protein TU52_07780 [Bacillus cereus]MBU5218089.1 hypothetical protein [Bacillus albus]MDC6155127.1 hypothetical protein [Bacillus albus]MDD8004604.1 hypothetical protein [Bacillus albus]RXJ21333.1 hypothetical protein ETJ91_08410 [Bacillus albus]